MQRYEKYKDSGVDWIGEIPEHWKMLSNKYIFKLKKIQVGKKSADYELLSLTLKGIIKRDMENPEGKFPAEFDTYQEVKKGDFIFCLFDVEETPRTVGLSDFDGMITGAYTVFTASEETDRKYLYYFYLNLDEKKRLKFLYRGLRNTIPKDSFFTFKTTFPPIEEQQTIATFLDDKTSKIDQTIGNKQKEIELLKERRQILIQKAVTKGLDDTVPLKDSVVDWIGEIPEHWEVRKLKYVLTMRNEKIESKSTDKVYVGMENVESQTGKYLQTDSQVEGLANAFYKDDILFGKLRPYLAKVYLSEFDGICSTEFLVYKSSNASFYQRVLLSDVFIKLVDSSTYGAKMPRASAEFINKISIPNPPNHEQIQIVTYLEAIEEKIAKAILLKQQEIEKLKEYKTVLIDNVVTGKVRVS